MNLCYSLFNTGKFCDKFCPWCISPSPTNDWERSSAPSKPGQQGKCWMSSQCHKLQWHRKHLGKIQCPPEHRAQLPAFQAVNSEGGKCAVLEIAEWAKYEWERAIVRRREVWIGGFHIKLYTDNQDSLTRSTNFHFPIQSWRGGWPIFISYHHLPEISPSLLLNMTLVLSENGSNKQSRTFRVKYN